MSELSEGAPPPFENGYEITAEMIEAAELALLDFSRERSISEEAAEALVRSILALL